MIIKEDFTKIRREVQDEQQQIAELQTAIEDLQESWDTQRKESEVEEFRDNVLEYQDSISGDMQLDSLETLVEDILQAYNDPVLSSIERLIDDIIIELDIEVDEDDIGQIVARVEEHEKELTDLRDAYQQSLEYLESSSEVVLTQIAEEIKKHHVKISSPQPNLLEPLNRKRDNYAILSQATGEFSSENWAPKQLPLQENPELYPDSEIKKDHLLRKGRRIEENHTTLSDLGISWHLAIKSEIESEFSLTKINLALEIVAKRCGNLASQEEYIEIASNITEYDVPKIESDKIQSTLNSLQENEYTSLDELEDELETLAQVLEDWKQTLQDQWERTESLLSKYEDVLDTTRPDDVMFDNSFDKLLDSDVTAALEIYQAARAWLERQRDEGLDALSESAQEVFEQLLSDEQVYLSDCDLDDLSELSNIANILLSIEYE